MYEEAFCPYAGARGAVNVAPRPAPGDGAAANRAAGAGQGPPGKRHGAVPRANHRNPLRQRRPRGLRIQRQLGLEGVEAVVLLLAAQPGNEFQRQ